jgi:hypothetical protein
MVSEAVNSISVLKTLKLCKDKKLLWNLKEGGEKMKDAHCGLLPNTYRLRTPLSCFLPSPQVLCMLRKATFH